MTWPVSAIAPDDGRTETYGETTSPVLALAPMQDVTDHAFWKLMATYGGADIYYTEYFRVHADSRLEKWILKSIDENPTGRPVVGQFIGNDIPSLVRSAKELQHHPVAAIDLNLGCPAPVVYKKCAGGGLLRDLPQVDRILGALRAAVAAPVRFTVKTRVGFDSAAPLAALLPMLARHGVDLVTVHGRTVAGMYRTPVDYELIAAAAAALPCPVLANGNVDSPATAASVLSITKARGLMIGRGAIRNPWIFNQIRQHRAGKTLTLPTGYDVLAYITALYEAVSSPEATEAQQVQKMKKYLNFIGLGVEPTGVFLHAIRRATSRSEFFHHCTTHLSHSQPMPLTPFPLPLKPCDVLAQDP